ncbi:hypothetical protein [Paenibacillus sp. yr247]|uniref:hypothetical protein n=1 Tax=Paenibacillus sp. yr247 TaxID=1761880 RepID=UPI000B898C25|nr:hypothetical protein [Paenibacillus sp. yr247]
MSRAAQAAFPVQAIEFNTLTLPVTLQPHRATQVLAFISTHFQIRDIIRISFKGDIDKQGKKVEVTVVATDSSVMSVIDAGTFFRHHDLIKTDHLV